MTAALDQKVANAMGLKSVNNCEKWSRTMAEDSTYLGDGVYASTDGFQLWLAANHPDNKVIALEPDVFQRLLDYVERLKDKNT